MPRRPRPATRRPPPQAVLAAPAAPALTSPTAARQKQSQHEQPRDPAASDPEIESENDALESDEEEKAASGSSSSNSSHGSDEIEDVDVDAPRVAQYVDEEDLDGLDTESEPELSSEEEEPLHLVRELPYLASLPFGALWNAQKTLSRATAFSDSEDEETEDEVSGPEQDTSRSDAKGKGKEIEDGRKPKKEIPKRKNKHSPQEVSSKKPVARKKLGVEESKVVPRDPRFLTLAGEFDSKRFQTQYGFLAGMHTQEMKTLRENLKRARKLLANSPRDLREEREQEVQRLERAYKRAESQVSKDRREKIEQEALGKVAKEEKEKRSAGKGAWYLKNADKKELLLRAKYDALAASGGRGAVKKAIDRRQKKTSQKEKKRRPFAPGQTVGHVRKRASSGPEDDGQRSGKRRRMG
ncbi:hypothetical protein IEO21_00129 [Rhodonia placenta]|uniref:rRNA biogenesis protein RRP36 n=1 Tax=Rhodonia placenta TaxID=104341 RepID=A0A8H7U7M8_9APHY|nr:hypothetical protein IEO21_00129 [Postia placenta]